MLINFQDLKTDRLDLALDTYHMLEFVKEKIKKNCFK